MAHQSHTASTAHAGQVASTEQALHAAHAEHDAHAGHAVDHAGHVDLFRRRFWITLLLAIPVILYSEMVQHWLGFTSPAFPGSALIAPGLGTIIFLYGGSVFLRGGWDELKTRTPGMMLLISLAISVAFIASAATSLGFFDLEFWWELALLIVIMLLGHWQEMRALGQAQGALSALAVLLPDEASASPMTAAIPSRSPTSGPAMSCWCALVRACRPMARSSMGGRTSTSR
ncbi:Copper-translocating P-type ATPase (fragment) [Nitrolancea hollandica Lb]|uniref:Copper-translocating P-type ATPase n=1 Tax=Nitrolancea hollandica Lb TaxID=1129897 RepID=I4ECG0_9BACT